MQVIKDIRVDKSDIPNIAGNSLPGSLLSKKVNIYLRRIVMKLRENQFSLGNFHHLYINLTTCQINGGIAMSQRTFDPKVRYYDVEVSHDFYRRLDTEICDEEIIELVEKVLITCFATDEFNKDKIHECIEEAMSQKENMLMKFKEKRSAKNMAVIYLRLLNNGYYKPLLRVYDLDNHLLLERDLPEMIELLAIGEISLSSKKVTIKPRKSIFAKNLKPMTFEIKS